MRKRARGYFQGRQDVLKHTDYKSRAVCFDKIILPFLSETETGFSWHFKKQCTMGSKGNLFFHGDRIRKTSNVW